MEQITAVIITHNEADNIGRCLDSLKGVADEVVVVDSGSTDATEAISRASGARFERHDWCGYAEQKNYANSLATHPWLLSIDADEELSDTLRRQLLGLKASGLDKGTVYAVRRLNNYCGQWIRHGGWYPDIKRRLWHKATARWEGTIHEELCGGWQREQLVAGDLLHYSYKSFAALAQRQERYAALAAEAAFARGKRCKATTLWLRPLWTFVRNYLFKGGFLDGRAGYIVCRMSAHYNFMKYALLQEKQKQETSCPKEQ